MMTPEELRAIMDYLRERVRLETRAQERPVVLTFLAPTGEEMIGAGLDPEGSRRVLGADWWEEMVDDVIGTPDFCEPDDPPEQVLSYARDVVSEYIRKRFPLDAGRAGAGTPVVSGDKSPVRGEQGPANGDNPSGTGKA